MWLRKHKKCYQGVRTLISRIKEVERAMECLKVLESDTSNLASSKDTESFINRLDINQQVKDTLCNDKGIFMEAETPVLPVQPVNQPTGNNLTGLKAYRLHNHKRAVLLVYDYERGLSYETIETPDSCGYPCLAFKDG
uniref:Transposase n=1 Tax=Caenorhabditis tropicalis TaxID=1561998 RepID=A0A1I7SYD7_9PELO